MKTAISEEDNKALHEKLHKALHDMDELRKKKSDKQKQNGQKKPWWKRILGRS